MGIHRLLNTMAGHIQRVEAILSALTVQIFFSSGKAAHSLCRFYTHLPAFERERQLYEATDLKKMMPATHAIFDNSDGNVTASNGYVFPPCIIIERGESLDQWARRESERDFVTTLQVCVMLAFLHVCLHVCMCQI
jgi:hypothetical protein